MTAITPSLIKRLRRTTTAPIRLHVPVQAGADGKRPNYVPQRSLGSTEFTLEARYLDWRLLGIGAGANPGVLDGLELSPSRYDAGDGVDPLQRITVQPGIGIVGDGRALRLSAPLTAAWADLVAVWTGAAESGASRRTLGDGAYLLAVRPISFETLHGGLPDPAARDEVDPTLDERQDSFVELLLSESLALPLTLPTSPPHAADAATDWALVLNRLAASLTVPVMVQATGGGVPIGLVLVQGGKPILVSEAAGRLIAQPRAERALLLAQVRETIAIALSGMTAINEEALKKAGQQLRFLPAAGEFPLAFLLDPAAPSARLPFLPPGLNVNFAAVRASRARALLEREIRRAPIDLAAPTEDGLTLLLAIADRQWRPDLLDLPRGDPLLPADLYGAFVGAHAAQIAAAHAWDALYGGLGDRMTDTVRPTLNFLLSARVDETLLARIPVDDANRTVAAVDAASDTPEALASWITTNQIPLPQAPDQATVQKQLDLMGYRVEQPRPVPPADPDESLKPLAPSLPPGVSLSAWAQFSGTTLPQDDTAPGTPGLLLKLAVLQQAHALLGQIIRGHQVRLDSHDRVLVLQRHHLDVLSSYGSSLAGGVPADGTGLQFARLIPFIKLDAPLPPPGTVAGGQPSLVAETAPATPTSTLGRLSAAFSASASLTSLRTAQLASFAAAPAGTAAFSPRPVSDFATSDFAARSFVPRPINGGIVSRIPIGDTVSSFPTTSVGGAFVRRRDDVASNVASQIGALTQQPQFDFSTTNYGQARHLVPASEARNTLKLGFDTLRDLANNNLGLNLPDKSQLAASDMIESHAYSDMMVIGRDLIGHIQAVQAAALLVEARYRRYRDRLAALEQQIAAAEAAIPAARATLADAMRVFGAASGTYASAQRLVAEDVERVADTTGKRADAIAAATGLFWIRQRQTAIARELATPLPLDTLEAGDLVPGCAADHDGPPATVLPFLDWVLELPAWDFWPLRPLWPYLPQPVRLPEIAMFRAARLGAKTPTASFGTSAAATTLNAMHESNKAAFGARLSMTTVPIARTVAMAQQNALRVFAVHDLFVLPGSFLRRQAEALRQRMETACGCLYEKLQDLPPSARFDLSALAARDALDVLDPATWPLTGIVRADAFATVRSLAALVAWLRRQVADEPSALALPALSRLVRATVIASAYGQPDESLSGTVLAAPPRFRPGVPIRVTLNRAAPVGTLLDVFDERQAVVGQVRVEDADETGASARVVKSTITETVAATKFTLALSKLR